MTKLASFHGFRIAQQMHTNKQHINRLENKNIDHLNYQRPFTKFGPHDKSLSKLA